MIKIQPGSEFENEGREGAVIKAGHTCPSWESSEMTHAQGPVFFCPPQWTLSHGINMTTFRVSLPPRLILFGNKPDILTFITYLVGPYVCQSLGFFSRAFLVYGFNFGCTNVSNILIIFQFLPVCLLLEYIKLTYFNIIFLNYYTTLSSV